MKIRHALALALLLLAVTAGADTQTVLTSTSTAWSVDDTAKGKVLELTRRTGEDRETVVVPGTYDEAMESQARLLWDNKTKTLFVIWNRVSETTDEIMLSRLDDNGQWSEAIVVASGDSRAGLQAALTRSDNTTLVHLAWWSLGAETIAKYALVAFESGLHVSTDVSDLDDLFVTAKSVSDAKPQPEDTGAALHPPLAMSRSGEGVEIVYGNRDSTGVTRIQLDPSRIANEARLWRPVGKVGGRTGRTGLVAATMAPVQAFVSKGRIVLYTPDDKFRYVVYENGKWSQVQMIKVDEKLTKEQLRHELIRQLDDLEPEQPDDTGTNQ